MPIPAPYTQGPPQGYGSMPGYPRGAPRPPIPREGGPTNQPGIPRATGVPAAGGAPAPRPGPQGSIVPPRGAPGVPPPAGRAPQAYKANPPVARNGPPPAQAGTAPPATGGGTLPLDPAILSSASPMEQKQMLGEVIYMRIVPSQPELAGKITGMLLEMDNAELLHLLENPDAMGSKVSEALAVLQEFAQRDDVAAGAA